MGIKRIQIRPKGSGSYEDILHPETSSNAVKMTGTETTLDSKLNTMQSEINGLNGMLNGKVNIGEAVASADKLETARYIDGLEFNGTENVFNYGTCSTSSATQVKVIIMNTPVSYLFRAGLRMSVKFTNANTHSTPSMKMGSGSAKPILKADGTPFIDILAGGVYTFVYDGTAFIVQGEGGVNNDSDPTSIAHYNVIASESPPYRVGFSRGVCITTPGIKTEDIKYVVTDDLFISDSSLSAIDTSNYRARFITRDGDNILIMSRLPHSPTSKIVSYNPELKFYTELASSVVVETVPSITGSMLYRHQRTNRVFFAKDKITDGTTSDNNVACYDLNEQKILYPLGTNYGGYSYFYFEIDNVLYMGHSSKTGGKLYTISDTDAVATLVKNGNFLKSIETDYAVPVVEYKGEVYSIRSSKLSSINEDIIEYALVKFDKNSLSFVDVLFFRTYSDNLLPSFVIINDELYIVPRLRSEVSTSDSSEYKTKKVNVGSSITLTNVSFVVKTTANISSFVVDKNGMIYTIYELTGDDTIFTRNTNLLPKPGTFFIETLTNSDGAKPCLGFVKQDIVTSMSPSASFTTDGLKMSFVTIKTVDPSSGRWA